VTATKAYVACRVCEVEPCRIADRCTTCHRYFERNGVERPEEIIVRHYERKVEREVECRIECERRETALRVRLARLRLWSEWLEANGR
jgi:hypothetical protein